MFLNWWIRMTEILKYNTSPYSSVSLRVFPKKNKKKIKKFSFLQRIGNLNQFLKKKCSVFNLFRACLNMFLTWKKAILGLLKVITYWYTKLLSQVFFSFSLLRRFTIIKKKILLDLNYILNLRKWKMLFSWLKTIRPRIYLVSVQCSNLSRKYIYPSS